MNTLHLTLNYEAKAAAAKAAADSVTSGMIIGLGTGSTATLFIDRLAQRCVDGLRIQAIATSKKSYEYAESLHIPLLNLKNLTEIDLTIDGADEIDTQKRMIKGGGGALLREKIVATMSREMIVIIDHSKYVESLGAFPLPIEILPFAFQATLHHINKLGYQGNLRMQSNGTVFITDNGNYIYDLKLEYPCLNPEEVNNAFLLIPGVLETGFFFHLAKKVIVGDAKGNIQIL